MGDLHRFEPTLAKKSIEGLEDSSVEFGETLLMKFADVKCEHNLTKLGSSMIRGNLYLTDFKLVFKPDLIRNTTSMQMNSNIIDDPNCQLDSKNVLDFFTVPYGYLFSLDVKTQVAGNNKVKQSSL